MIIIYPAQEEISKALQEEKKRETEKLQKFPYPNSKVGPLDNTS
jgi:hypothetical protein